MLNLASTYSTKFKYVEFIDSSLSCGGNKGKVDGKKALTLTPFLIVSIVENKGKERGHGNFTNFLFVQIKGNHYYSRSWLRNSMNKIRVFVIN